MTITGRISGYSVATKQERPFRPELMFGLIGALIGHGIRDGQPDVVADYRTYDIQTEAGPTLWVVTRQEFEGTPCVEVTASSKAIHNNFVGLGAATLREINTCSALKPVPLISAEDIKEKPGRPN